MTDLLSFYLSLATTPIDQVIDQLRRECDATTAALQKTMLSNARVFLRENPPQYNAFVKTVPIALRGLLP